MALNESSSRFRRFARAVTSELGALDSSFLGRGRPLGSARMLNAIGRGKTNLGELREYLGLDSGLASRTLRELEGEGLVVTRADQCDGRRRVMELTSTGRREFEIYEKLSNERAQTLLARSPDRAALLEAMDLVANLLLRDRVRVQQIHPTSAEARYCLSQYSAELDRRFQGGFEVSRSRDPHVMDLVAPRGAFLIAISDDRPIGCVALKRTDEETGEIKRLWVARSARGLGIARHLMQTAEKIAHQLGIAELRLDTNRALPEALEMYKNWGWTEIGPFNDDPYADYFFAKRLDARTTPESHDP